MSGGVEELRKTIAELVERIDRLERMLEESQRNVEAEALALALTIVRVGLGSMDVAASVRRLAMVSRLLKSKRVKDDISRTILEVIAVKGAKSISELEREVRRLRGSASRRIISERVDRLREMGIVEVERRGKRKVVRLKNG